MLPWTEHININNQMIIRIRHCMKVKTCILTNIKIKLQWNDAVKKHTQLKLIFKKARFKFSAIRVHEKFSH